MLYPSPGKGLGLSVLPPSSFLLSSLLPPKCSNPTVELRLFRHFPFQQYATVLFPPELKMLLWHLNRVTLYQKKWGETFGFVKNTEAWPWGGRLFLLSSALYPTFWGPCSAPSLYVTLTLTQILLHTYFLLVYKVLIIPFKHGKIWGTFVLQTMKLNNQTDLISDSASVVNYWQCVARGWSLQLSKPRCPLCEMGVLRVS